MNASEVIRELVNFTGKYDRSEWWIFYEDEHLMNFMARRYPDLYDFIENALKTDKGYNVNFSDSIHIAGITIKDKKPILFLNPHRITHIKNLQILFNEPDYPLNAYRFYIYILIHEALHVILQNFRHLPLDSFDHFARNIAQDMIIDNIIYLFSSGEWRNWSDIVPEINKFIRESGLFPNQKLISLESKDVYQPNEKFILDFNDWELAILLKMLFEPDKLKNLTFDSIDIPSEGEISERGQVNTSQEESASKSPSQSGENPESSRSSSSSVGNQEKQKIPEDEQEGKEWDQTPPQKDNISSDDGGERKGSTEQTEKGESPTETEEKDKGNKSFDHDRTGHEENATSKEKKEHSKDPNSRDKSKTGEETEVSSKNKKKDIEDSDFEAGESGIDDHNTTDRSTEDLDEEILNRIKSRLHERKMQQSQSRDIYKAHATIGEKILREIELEAIDERTKSLYNLLRKYIKAVDYKQREYTWKKFHRKFPGIYPGYKLRKTPGEIAIIIDTSGSMGSHLNNRVPACIATIKSAIEAIEKNFGFVSRFFFATVSDHLHKGKFEEITREQLKNLKLIVGKSTDYKEIFEKLSNWRQHTVPPSRKNSPDIIIFITDLEVSFDFMFDISGKIKSQYKKFNEKLIWIFVGDPLLRRGFGSPPVGKVLDISGNAVSRGYYKAKGVINA
ncbi:MAG: hypothetical protein ABIM02_04910 [candidate division WOR-3 bacterium]